MINKNRYSTTNNNFELAKSLFLIKIIKKIFLFKFECILLIINNMEMMIKKKKK